MKCGDLLKFICMQLKYYQHVSDVYTQYVLGCEHIL